MQCGKPQTDFEDQLAEGIETIIQTALRRSQKPSWESGGQVSAMEPTGKIKYVPQCSQLWSSNRVPHQSLSLWGTRQKNCLKLNC